MKPVTERKAVRLLLLTLAASYLSVPPVLALADMTLDLRSARHFFAILAAMLPFIAYACWRKMAVVPEVLICVASVFALSLPILVWTYAAMRAGMPLADAQLVAMDAALGFDWHGFIAFVDARPRLAELLDLAYSSFYIQLALLPLVLAAFGFGQRAYALVVAYAVLCLVSSVVCIWYPALGTYVVYGVGLGDVSAINARFGFHFLDEFHAVRADGPFSMALDRSAGIVTFPSVHAGVAALCAWAGWALRGIRYPILLLNVAMAVSAVSHANHYLVDIIAGIGIAGLSASLATAVFHERSAGAAPRKEAVTDAASSPVSASG